MEHLWDNLRTKIQPVPRDIVAAMEFDDPSSNNNWVRDCSHWAGSGHYGKELNLMLSGHKRVALFPEHKLDQWAPHIVSKKWITASQIKHTIVVCHPEQAALEIIDACWDDNGTGIGIALGYQLDDIHWFIQRWRDLGRASSTIEQELAYLNRYRPKEKTYEREDI